MEDMLRRKKPANPGRLALVWGVIFAAMIFAMLAGCGYSGPVNNAVAFGGSVHGGHQPVSGATIQLYATGTSGVGSAAQPLLSEAITSDSDGNFSIPATYTCPSSSSQVYVVARGGNPGLASGGNNPALQLTAMLGSCSKLSAGGAISVNEVTTVGSVWPLAQYMKSPTNIGSAKNDASFLAAVSTVPEFINIAQGSSPGTPAATSYFAENSKLYSLADVLADCVSSSGGVAGDGSPCGHLFSISAPAGGSAPTDTMTAAMRIAQSPANAVAGIYGLVAPDTPYLPALVAAPPDWTLTLTYLVATPTISAATGTYVGAQQVTISDSTAGTTIYYTTDGTVPTTSSTIYTGPISIAVSSTVQAIAVLSGSQSPVAASVLTITSPLAPAALAFMQQPSDAVAGATISPGVQVVVQDGNGNTAAAATNPITISLVGGAGLGGTQTVIPQNGIATFSNLTVSTPGSYTFSATSPGLSSATSSSFTIRAPGGTATSPVKLAFAQQPTNALTGAAVSPAVQVVVEDANGNTVTAATAPVTVALTSSAGLGGTLWTTIPINGIATFANITVSTAGSGYTLLATSPNLSSATSASFTISAPGGGAPPPPVKLAFLQQPSNALTGATISPAVQVAVEDSTGNVVTAATNPVTLALSSGSGLQGTLTVVAQKGIATFSTLGVSAAGSYTLSATSSGLTSATSASFTITTQGGGTPPPATKLAFSQQPSNALTGAAISPAVQVAVEDSTGNVVTTATNSVTISLAGGSGLGGTLTVAAQNGIATFGNLSLSAAGSYTLSAASSGLTSAVSASFTISSSGGGTPVPAKLAFSQQPSDAFMGAAISPAVRVVVEDSNGNVVTSASNPVTLALQGGSGLAGTLTATPQNGIAIFNNLTVSAAGSYTLLATSPSLTSATSTSFTIAKGLSTVESLGAIPANQAFNGLGFNLTTSNDWEFKMAAAAGATHARYQCSWVTTENQTAPPNNTSESPQFTLQSDCQAALVSAANVGIHSTIVAAYGAPFHQILTVYVPAGASAGAKSIQVEFASGAGGDTLSSMAPFYDTIIGSSKNPITNKHSYAGGLITGVTLQDSTHATLTLASALSSALPANTSTEYVINEYLYPPPASSSPTDPSVVAYAKYAAFLASKISASGVSGEVELWNEPPWSDDPWDNRGDYYDVWPGSPTPGPQAANYPNAGFVAALQGATPPAGTNYNWGGTEKSGANSVFLMMPSNTGVAFKQPNNAVTTESFHPYGNNPEDELWSAPCLAATINPYPAAPKGFSACNLGDKNANIALAVQNSLVQQSRNSSWGIGHNITETGIATATVDQAHQARFIMRQFLGYQAAGVTPVQFYRLYDDSGGGFGFVDPSTHAPLPSLVAIAGLMSDLAAISNAAVGSGSLPSIVSYSGTYPLDTVSMVGTRSGDTVNSVLFAVWQRSNTTTGVWGALASPAPAPVVVQIPANVNVVGVINLDTRDAVSYTTSGQQITFNVGDDPVEVLIEP